MEFFADVDNKRNDEEHEVIGSNCSIEGPPQALSNKNIYGHSPGSISGRDLQDKSMKYIADRFLPIRKTPCSAKELFNDQIEWMED